MPSLGCLNCGDAASEHGIAVKLPSFLDFSPAEPLDFRAVFAISGGAAVGPKGEVGRS
jgi:hypothetical protein